MKAEFLIVGVNVSIIIQKKNARKKHILFIKVKK